MLDTDVDDRPGFRTYRRNLMRTSDKETHCSLHDIGMFGIV